MARKTKEDAQATYDGILDAAELLFVRQGVSRTTLQHIATAAGVTRGAIYWHFEDKGGLFKAMLERARMPLEAAMQELDRSEPADPLHGLREHAMRVFRLTMEDPKARRVFEIATLKMEYIDELSAVRERRRDSQKQWMGIAEKFVRLGIKQGQIKPGIRARAVGVGLWVLVEGLVRNWLINPDYDLIKLGGEVIDTHLDGLRP